MNPPTRVRISPGLPLSPVACDIEKKFYGCVCRCFGVFCGLGYGLAGFLSCWRVSPWDFSRRRRVGPGGGCFGVEGGGGCVSETFVGGLNLPGATLFYVQVSATFWFFCQCFSCGF